jgi:hypothetical protein
VKTKKVKVGGRIFKLQETPLQQLNDEDRMGDMTAVGVIRYADSIPGDFQAEIIIHEILHALIYDSHMDISVKAEERLVLPLAPRLAAFMRDNPAFMAELAKLLK